MATKSAPAGTTAPAPAETPRPSKVQWNDKNMATHFANVVNVQSTREQVDLFFGTNQTWNIVDGPAVSVDLTNRIILTPFAAKRLGSPGRRAVAPRAARSLTCLTRIAP